MVPIPREEAAQTPLGQVWVRAGDLLGPAQASVCKPGRQLLAGSGLPRRASKETNILWAPSGHQAQCQPYDITTIINTVLLNRTLGHIFSKTVDHSPLLGYENSLAGDKKHFLNNIIKKNKTENFRVHCTKQGLVLFCESFFSLMCVSRCLQAGL